MGRGNGAGAWVKVELVLSSPPRVRISNQDVPLKHWAWRAVFAFGAVSVFTLMQLGWAATAIFLSGLFLAGEASVRVDRWAK